ncbi:hypothetical protein KC318_g6295 [Hortaea werneckii]|nr:hypothetical protein KC334_g5582 [Hortaea werneckii]KAI7015169.1 hypothetical protein KC355_g4419 [Hortaea werneckii]KAI7666785.1 hypothetical protein KC318_g6295 [Hortaea werneckii]
MDSLGRQSAPPHEEPATQLRHDTIDAAPANESPNTTVDAGNTASTASRTTIASPQTDNTQTSNNLNVPLHNTTRPPRRAPSDDPGTGSFAERRARRLQAMREAMGEGNSSRRHQNGQGRSGTAHRQRERMQDNLGFGQTTRSTRLEREVDLSRYGEPGPCDELDDTWQDDDEIRSPVEIFNALEMIVGSARDSRRRCRNIYEDVLAEEEAEDRAELDNTTWFELSEAGRRALEEQGFAMPRQGETWTFVGEEYAERLRRAFGQY